MFQLLPIIICHIVLIGQCWFRCWFWCWFWCCCSCRTCRILHIHTYYTTQKHTHTAISLSSAITSSCICRHASPVALAVQASCGVPVVPISCALTRMVTHSHARVARRMKRIMMTTDTKMPSSTCSMDAHIAYDKRKNGKKMGKLDRMIGGFGQLHNWGLGVHRRSRARGQ